MTAAFDHMARGETLTKTRWHNRGAQKRKAHLTAMSVARKCERHTIRNVGKDVWIVREEENRSSICVHAGEGCLDVVRSRPEVADAGYPGRSGGSVDSHGGIFNDSDAGLLHRSPHAVVIEPRVMIAKNGQDTCWRPKIRQFRGNGFWRNEPSTGDALNDEVPENADDVGPRRVRARDNRTELFEAVERRADVKIGEHGNAQRTVRGPGNIEVLFDDDETGRLQPERSQAERERDAARDGQQITSCSRPRAGRASIYHPNTSGRSGRRSAVSPVFARLKVSRST